MQTPTLIDLLMSNNADFIKNVTHFPPLGLSHHSVLTCQIVFTLPKKSDYVTLKYQMDKADYVSMRSDMSRVEWDTILNPEDHVNIYCDHIHSHIKTVVDKYVPIRKCKQNDFKRPQTQTGQHRMVAQSKRREVRDIFNKISIV
jgi:hypothetical protein